MSHRSSGSHLPTISAASSASSLEQPRDISCLNYVACFCRHLIFISSVSSSSLEMQAGLLPTSTTPTTPTATGVSVAAVLGNLLKRGCSVLGSCPEAQPGRTKEKTLGGGGVASYLIRDGRREVGQQLFTFASRACSKMQWSP